MSYRVIRGRDFSDLLDGKVTFILCIGNTMTAEIPGITVAGESPELIKFTPPADAELLCYGYCKSIPFPPATPDGKPTPALITYTALRLTHVPLFVVDSGLIEKPKMPYWTVNAPVGRNIAEESAMDLEDVKRTFNYGKILGKELSKEFDVLVIGESIPAGTTTAGAVLKAMGLDPKVSSSMPENPVDIKRRVMDMAVSRVESDDPLEIMAEVGDPVLVTVSGISTGFAKHVILAGGTQMAAVSQIVNALNPDAEVHIVTTKYVAEDKTSDIAEISATDVIASDPGLEKSTKAGLRAYGQGFVKEGVGAGGASLLVYRKGYTTEQFLREVERDYEVVVEQVRS